MNQFLEYSKCVTCKKARAWLAEEGVEYESRDLIQEPLVREEILELAEAAGGLQAILAKRSPSYARYRDQMDSDEGIIAAMLAEPRLIRRPILRTSTGLHIGFQPQKWADWKL